MLFKLYCKITLLVCLILGITEAKFYDNNLSFFEDKPRSIAKDYYIYRYLKEHKVTSKEAWELIQMSKNLNMTLFHLFAKQVDDKEIKKISKCLKMSAKALLKEDEICLAVGLSLYDLTKLNKKEIRSLKTKLSTYYISKFFPIFYSDKPFEELNKLNTRDFLTLYNSVGSTYRKLHLDHKLSKEKIKEIEKDPKINQMIKLIVTSPKIKNINKSLLYIEPNNPKLDHKSLFFLALNALKQKNDEKSLKYLKEAYKKAYYKMDKDKVLFWQYKITNDKKYRDELFKSFDLNIYTLLAGVKNNRIIVSNATGKKENFNISDPFNWTKLLDEIKNKDSIQLKNLAQNFYYANTLPYFTFIMEKTSGYKDHYFAMPYKNFLSNADKKRIALIYAIARQESRLVPSAVSHSYALGMMQFMPFLAKAIAKQEKFKNFDLDYMFKPEIALKFANIHLNYLEKYLFNPLLVAYAYNGGIGFTKRVLKSGLFKDGEFEPYMSMELIPYDESREYGKKVLANYATYMQILGENLDLKELLKQLLEPKKSDKFRN